MFGSCFRTLAVKPYLRFVCLFLNICDPCIYHQLRRAGTPTTRLVRSTPATSPTQPMVRNARRGPSTTPYRKIPRHTNLTACTPPTTNSKDGGQQATSRIFRDGHDTVWCFKSTYIFYPTGNCDVPRCDVVPGQRLP